MTGPWATLPPDARGRRRHRLRRRAPALVVIDWFQQLWDELRSISIPLLILGLAFETAQILLVALAWRNVLRAAYGREGTPYRKVLSFYAGSTGLNAILPGSAGTIAMLGLFRAYIPGATAAGLVAATVVQSLFFAVMSAGVYLFMFLTAAGSFDVKFGWFSDHPVVGVVIVVGGVALIVFAVHLVWRKFKTTWAKAKEGGGILSTPRKFLIQVVGPEVLSYVARMGMNATFMYAYGIPVSVENIFLIVAATSISSTIAVLPGAVGAQTGLASVVLRGEASQAAISAYSVGQSIIVTAWNVLFGLTLLAQVIGWKETRSLIHVRKKTQDDGEAAGTPAADTSGDGAPT
jgi:uncharacterized membrane protein YbhN (UPF0104 family)